MLEVQQLTLSEIFGRCDGDRTGLRDDLFHGGRNPAQRYTVYRPQRDDSLELPLILSISDEAVDEFFATSTSLFSNQSPISAFAHIVTDATRDLVDGGLTTDRGPEISADLSRRLRIMVGAMIGEGSITAVGQAPSYKACRSTFSFALARAALVHSTRLNIEDLANRWDRIRAYTDAAPSREEMLVSRAIHTAAFSAHYRKSELSFPEPIYYGLSSWLTYGDEGRFVSELAKFYPDARRAVESLSGAFDSRLSAFLEITSAVMQSANGHNLNALAAAYFCNQILPGSFAHADLLRKFGSSLPSALIWYGAFSSLTPPKGVASAQAALSLKLTRDLGAPFSFEDRPTCDISLEELVVTSRGAAATRNIRQNSSDALSVAVIPGVNIPIGLPGARSERIKSSLDSHASNDLARDSVISLLEDAIQRLKGGSKPRVIEDRTVATRRSKKPQK